MRTGEPEGEESKFKSETGSVALFFHRDGNLRGGLPKRNRGEHTISLCSATHFSVWRHTELSTWCSELSVALELHGRHLRSKIVTKVLIGLSSRTNAVSLSSKLLVVDDGRYVRRVIGMDDKRCC